MSDRSYQLTNRQTRGNSNGNQTNHNKYIIKTRNKKWRPFHEKCVNYIQEYVLEYACNTHHGNSRKDCTKNKNMISNQYLTQIP